VIEAAGADEAVLVGSNAHRFLAEHGAELLKR